MTKSTITRERLEALANAEYCKSNPGAWLLGLKEVNELARMALAAMDSEPVALDYLQGHKDGLEWAALLAEANHPETGDWLYDDPIELSKAIRKGPDMPPAQPVADSEPDRNPVLAYADSYRDMAKQGVESVPIWSVITDLERNIAPLYRHAQPVPVVSADLLHTAASAIEDLLTTKDRTGAGVWFDLPSRLRSAANAQPAPEKYNIGDATMRHIFTPTGMTNVSDMQAVFDRVEAVLVGMDQPAPVVPDGYVMVPMRLTAENGAKGALSGEFSETKFVNCPECFGDDECETCDGSGRIEITVPVTWTTIKEIWAKGVEHFSATPREVKGE
ncbi:hypothetical protein ACXDHR_003553 [Klebsiella pneumoniae]